MFPSTAFVLRLVALLFFTGFTAAHSIKISRRSIHSRDKGVAVVDTTRVVKNNAHTVQKLANGLSTYHKNTGKRHTLSESIEHSRKRETGSEPLTFSPYLWYGAMTVGTPPQQFTVQFDTANGDLTLPGKHCKSSCEGYRRYHPNASSTSVNLHKSYHNLLGSNASIVGRVYTDVVKIGGLSAHGQALAAVTSYSPARNHTFVPADGLMGMAFQSISNMDAPPVFQTLVDEGAVHCPMFAFKLSTTPNQSVLTLGGVDHKLYTGGFTWVPLNTTGYWQAAFHHILVDGKEVVSHTQAVFDIGATGLVSDPRTISEFFTHIPGAKLAPKLGDGLYTIPCDLNISISINFGGKDIHIDPRVFNFGPVFLNDTRTCLAGASSVPSLRGGIWILGDAFLMNVYSAWDVGNRRIGFADLR